jgi:hypothetical protein
VVVPVVYCYFDSLAIWASEKWHGRKPVSGQSASAAVAK